MNQSSILMKFYEIAWPFLRLSDSFADMKDPLVHWLSFGQPAHDIREPWFILSTSLEEIKHPVPRDFSACMKEGSDAKNWGRG